MTAQRISARSLLRETLAVVGSVYPALFTINSPHLIWSVLETLGRDALNLHIIERTLSEHPGAGTFPVNPIYRLAEVPFWIYWLVGVPLLCGATIFYTYRSLTGNQVSVGEAFKHAYRRVPQLICAWIPSALMLYIFFSALGFLQPLIFIALMISGLYLSIRLQFSLFATVIDNAAAQDSISSSWKLTKGREWLLFRETFLMGIVTAVPLQLISLLISRLMSYLPFSSGLGRIYQLVFIVLESSLEISMGVLISVYFVLLYRCLRDSAAAIQ